MTTIAELGLAAAAALSLSSGAIPAKETGVAAPGACAMVLAPKAVSMGSGTVLAFEDKPDSMARIPKAERDFQGAIDPDYIDNQRVIIHLDNGSDMIFLAPRGLPIRLADRVTVQSAFRNAALPCHYIPYLITADLGPATN